MAELDSELKSIFAEFGDVAKLRDSFCFKVDAEGGKKKRKKKASEEIVEKSTATESTAQSSEKSEPPEPASKKAKKDAAPSKDSASEKAAELVKGTPGEPSSKSEKPRYDSPPKKKQRVENSENAKPISSTNSNPTESKNDKVGIDHSTTTKRKKGDGKAGKGDDKKSSEGKAGKGDGEKGKSENKFEKKENTVAVSAKYDSKSSSTPVLSQPSTVKGGLAGLLHNMKRNLTKAPVDQAEQEKLSGSRFRLINEELYTNTGSNAFRWFKTQPGLFDQYHQGFAHQASQWPSNPVDLIIQYITETFGVTHEKRKDGESKKSAEQADETKESAEQDGASKKQKPQKQFSNFVIADLGCGEAQISRELNGYRVKNSGIGKGKGKGKDGKGKGKGKDGKGKGKGKGDQKGKSGDTKTDSPESKGDEKEGKTEGDKKEVADSKDKKEEVPPRKGPFYVDVKSFDLVPKTVQNVTITPCNINAHLPLTSKSVDVVVLCLALMGTDCGGALKEAFRVLNDETGLLLISEVTSRFESRETFVQQVQKFGFQLVMKGPGTPMNTSNTHFFTCAFTRRAANLDKTAKLDAKACIYKRR